MVRQVERSLLFLILIEDLHLSLLNVIQHVGVIDVTQVHTLSLPCFLRLEPVLRIRRLVGTVTFCIGQDLYSLKENGSSGLNARVLYDFFQGYINLLPTKAPSPFNVSSDERNKKFKYPVRSCRGLEL